MRLTKGILLATAASLLLTSHSFAAEKVSGAAKPVKCYGVNSCRGKAQCGEKNKNSCAGQNSCKGKGWIYMSSEQCMKKGGQPIN
ncbi:MAG: hypothetical protein H0U71_02535 [Gammaproteobacteria bacterium]|nr:hypothetical protein [Gammaproteobacteria bacterium]